LVAPLVLQNARCFSGLALLILLCRRAFELAFATTYMFAGSRPAFVRVDDITFRCDRLNYVTCRCVVLVATPFKCGSGMPDSC